MESNNNDQRIRIIQKPDNITIADIQALYACAHQSNVEKGIIHGTISEPLDKFASRFQNESCLCLVAMDGNKLVGTTSVDIIDVNKWYANEKTAHVFICGVLPNYKGQHIFTRLIDKVYEYADKQKLKLFTLNTAEHNVAMNRFAKQSGFKAVDFVSNKNSNCYSVIYVKWLDKCPFSDQYIRLRYLYKKYRVKIKYKPGRIRRF